VPLKWFLQSGILPEEYLHMMEGLGIHKEQVVCDYIAGMTDGYAISVFEDLFIPKAWKT